jgi:NCAIR mutase (PurE)-related protein
MEQKRIRALLRDLAEGRIDVDAALRQLRFLPFEDLGFVKVDHHRHLRRGFPEVVYAPGKTPEQLLEIVRSLARASSPVLVTRIAESSVPGIRKILKGAAYHAPARAVSWVPASWVSPEMEGILVLAAGTSDIPVAEEAALTAELMGNRVKRIYDVGVAGLHRLLAHREALLTARVLVVVAGMEGALPSVVGGLVDAPVIAVPTSVGYGAGSGGIAALLAMLNSCAGGVTVVNIDNGFGAGLAAGLINRIGQEGPGDKGSPARPQKRPRRAR